MSTSRSIDRLRVLTKADLRVAFRDGEQLLLTLGLPVLFLVFFSLVDVLPTGTNEPVDYLAPGILALALMSAAFVRLAIGIGFDIGFGAIRRFGVTPLRVEEFIGAKLATTVVLFIFQLIVLVTTALLLGWSPRVSALVVPAMLLGLVAFVGLAFVLTGLVDGLGALAAANALYVVLLLLSGIVFELDRLPGWLVIVVKLLPSTALAELLRSTLGSSAGPSWAWLCLAGWAIGTPILGSRLFRWS